MEIAASGIADAQAGRQPEQQLGRHVFFGLPIEGELALEPAHALAEKRNDLPLVELAQRNVEYRLMQCLGIGFDIAGYLGQADGLPCPLRQARPSLRHEAQGLAILARRDRQHLLVSPLARDPIEQPRLAGKACQSHALGQGGASRAVVVQRLRGGGRHTALLHDLAHERGEPLSGDKGLGLLLDRLDQARACIEHRGYDLIGLVAAHAIEDGLEALCRASPARRHGFVDGAGQGPPRRPRRLQAAILPDRADQQRPDIVIPLIGQDSAGPLLQQPRGFVLDRRDHVAAHQFGHVPVTAVLSVAPGNRQQALHVAAGALLALGRAATPGVQPELDGIACALEGQHQNLALDSGLAAVDPLQAHRTALGTADPCVDFSRVQRDQRAQRALRDRTPIRQRRVAAPFGGPGPASAPGASKPGHSSSTMRLA
ncbi:hypothetical protein IC580_01215 [Cupriavidus sp. ISTL7]|nr:hypothetical protein IC580_01215 [Cupriavidus sp. ISTL7]